MKRWIRPAVIGVLAGMGWVPTCTAGGPTGLRFEPAGAGFRFDTGELRGVLRGGGRPAGLTELVDAATGTNLAGRNGVLGFYRLLDADTRHPDGWGWTGGAARVLSDGAVEATWPADAAHPFELRAVYRWRTPSTLDLETTLTARKALRRMEVFVASYFNGFADSRVLAKTAGGAAFVAADEASGVWQAFPRDEAAVATVRDGRWARPPHPVEWAIRPPFAAPLGLRRDGPTGRTVLVMARPDDCFAVLTPHGAEAHRSLYLSLFGRDLGPGESASAVVRLAVGRGMTDAAAVSAWEEFRKP
ncbi:MAG: hypothetical protein FJ221_06680 [Lentisphaerae bacterium]|nr:hypothetical protein [Lentisphaerota bacterium]